MCIETPSVSNLCIVFIIDSKFMCTFISVHTMMSLMLKKCSEFEILYGGFGIVKDVNNIYKGNFIFYNVCVVFLYILKIHGILPNSDIMRWIFLSSKSLLTDLSSIQNFERNFARINVKTPHMLKYISVNFCN